MSQTKAQLISDLVQALNFTGTASAPANGLFLSAANTLKLATASTERLKIDGTEVVVNDTGADVDFRVESDTNTNFFKIDAGSEQASFGGTVTSSGYTLEVLRSTTDPFVNATDAVLRLTNTDNSAATNQTSLHFTTATSGNGSDSAIVSQSTSAGNSRLEFWTDTSNVLSKKMTLDAAGRLLVGTTTEGHPSADNLTIRDSGNAGITIRSGDTSNGAIFFSDATSGDAEFDGYVQYNHGAAPFMQFGVADDTVMALKGSNVGIGTTSPSTALHISQTNPELRLQGTNGNGGIHKIFTAGLNSESLQITGASNLLFNADTQSFRSSDESTDYMRIDSNGDVGIGTTNPTAKLHIVETTSIPAVKIKSGTDTNQNTHITLFNDNDVPLNLGVFGSAAGAAGAIAANTAFMSSNSSAGLAIAANNESGIIKFGTGSSTTTRMTIDSSGNVGIGTSSPATLLHLDVSGGAVLRMQRTGTNATNKLEFSHDGTDGTIESTNDLIFRTGGGIKATLLDTGNLGIGTTSPNERLMVVDAIANEPKIRIQTSDGGNKRLDLSVDSSGNGIVAALQSASNIFLKSRTDIIFEVTSTNVEAMRIDSSGKIKIVGTRSGALQANDDDALQLYTKSSTSDIDRGTGITFYTHDGSGFEMGGTIQVAKENGNANEPASYMRFNVQTGSTTEEAVRITSSKKVKIGTTDGNPHANADELTLGDASGTQRSGMTINSGTNKDGSIHFGDPDSNTSGQVNYDHDGDCFRFYTANDKRVRIDADGLKFGSDTATANALDDYEEGSWTPEFGNVNAPTYALQYGRYCKVGSQVMLVGQISVTSGLDTTDGSGVNIGGLPFTGNSAADVCQVTLGRYTSILKQTSLDSFTNVRFGGNFVMLMEGNNDDINYTNCNTSGILQFAISYITNT